MDRVLVTEKMRARVLESVGHADLTRPSKPKILASPRVRRLAAAAACAAAVAIGVVTIPRMIPRQDLSSLVSQAPETSLEAVAPAPAVDLAPVSTSARTEAPSGAPSPSPQEDAPAPQGGAAPGAPGPGAENEIGPALSPSEGPPSFPAAEPPSPIPTAEPVPEQTEAIEGTRSPQPEPPQETPSTSSPEIAPEPTDGGPLESPGYVRDVNSLEELIQAVGFPVGEPAWLPFSPSRRAYAAFGTEMAQIEYFGDGQTALLRKARGTEDVSGDYNHYDDSICADAGALSATLKGSGGEYVLATWSDGSFSWALSLSQGASLEEWIRILQSMTD